ncbi:MAG TPA: ribonuclease D [Thermoanaerobaculia bacterium]|nr:ribonuclease D [Thermoanaerobaculia bacterium]
MIWIDQQVPLDQALETVAAQSVVAVDTEADSLHSYFDKVCLIQISAGEEDLVIDPLAGVDLKRFGEMLADPKVTKLLHGGDYDLRILNRDFGFTIGNLIDTMVCSQLLGYEAFGLAALLDRHFGYKVDKKHQRADWAMRPLPADMLDYAATDTRHLIALADRLRDELTALGRWEWAVEEFARLEQIRFNEKDSDEEPFRRLKGLGTLDRRSLAVVRALYDYRDGLAREADRPPFKIFSNDLIFEVAKNKPVTPQEFGVIKGVSGYHRGRYSRDVVRLVQEALAIPEDELPEKGEAKTWLRDRELEARVDRMKKARDKIAKDLKVDASVLAPRHVLVTVAQAQPQEPGDLDRITSMRNWQKSLLGQALIDALRGGAKPPQAKLF